MEQFRPNIGDDVFSERGCKGTLLNRTGRGTFVVEVIDEETEEFESYRGWVEEWSKVFPTAPEIRHYKVIEILQGKLKLLREEEASVRRSIVDLERANKQKLTSLKERSAALTNKLLQLAGGVVYDADKNVHKIHDTKLVALEKLLKIHKDEPVLVLTAFIHEIDRVLKRLPGAIQFHEKHLGDWGKGRIKVMVANPGQMSHGIDGMQDGGRIIVWLTPTYDPQKYHQTNASPARVKRWKPSFTGSSSRAGLTRRRSRLCVTKKRRRTARCWR